jgi:predicted lipoprotein with Yx(FWY)xxD motif
MVFHIRVLLALFIATVAVILAAGLLTAAGETWWQDDGVEVCVNAAKCQAPLLVPDGSSGAIVAWYDARATNQNIYAQRVRANGTRAWAADGVSVCVAANDQEHHHMVGDGAGGAIVVWEDRRIGSVTDVYAQRVNPDGTMAWITDGVSLCIGFDYQYLPRITTDGAGGAIVAWYDTRGTGGYSDIYAQRVYSDGTAAWATNGVSLCTAANHQLEPQIATDGAGGAIVAWHDNRGSDTNIYAQRVYSDGTTAWITDGVTLCAAANTQNWVQIASDGARGAIVAWEDHRSGSVTDIYAQRVYSNGTVAWTTDGVSLCAELKWRRDAEIVPDGEGGAIVVWEDRRDPAYTDWDIYAQRVNPDGTLAWASNGVSLCVAVKKQEDPKITADGAGGAIVTWKDYRSNSSWDVYAQRLGHYGSVRWQADGITVCSASLHQQGPGITSDGRWGAIVAWEDGRKGDYPNDDIYAQRLGERNETNLPLVAKNH